uniref:potassium-transporting ATPase subunit C n=1 Tax=Salinibacterium sp. TaxID=1915057 RepID=UPI00286C544B
MKFRQTWTAIRALLIFTVVLGVVYPLAVTAVGQLVLPAQANGALIRVDGEAVGSTLIGQTFADADGNALPEWFQSRPSAAGDGYDGGASSGSNYGPENDDLIAAIDARREAIESLDAATLIPADALTASAS